jgi:hypothetical protein
MQGGGGPEPDVLDTYFVMRLGDGGQNLEEVTQEHGLGYLFFWISLVLGKTLKPLITT